MIKRTGSITASHFAIQARAQIEQGFYPVKGTAYQVSSDGYGACYSDLMPEGYDFSEVDCLRLQANGGLTQLDGYINRGFIIYDSIQLGGDTLAFVCREKKKEDKKSGWALVKYEEIESPE